MCSSCDATPGSDAVAGGACRECGERLIRVDTGDDLVGTTIDGRFEVLAPLGHGGMGVVYRAKQLSIGREVALKVLDRRIEKDVDAVKRFFREAKLSSKLAHPNTVPIIDFGQNADGRLYLAMELIKGHTLFDEINKHGALSIPRLVDIGVQLCDALEAAHELTIVHRDLKLENTMLEAASAGKRDHVRILDFGLARSLADPSTAMTATGLVSGTPRYMAPEVAIDTAPPAPSQDMYSLGVMLAELSIGRALWNAPTLEKLFMDKLEPEQALTGVPELVRPLVASLIAKDPAARPDAARTRAALRELAAGTGTAAGAFTHPPALTRANTPPASSVIRLEIEPPTPPANAPIALQPTADVSGVDPFANLQLVALDQREGAMDGAREDRPVAPAPTSPAEPELSRDVFDLPASQREPASLELDPSYVAERNARERQRLTPKQQRPPSRKAGTVVSLLMIALVAVGGYVFYRYRHRVDRVVPGGGVTIVITADREHEIFVDGASAGTTPLRLELPKSTRRMLVTSDGLVPQQIVADRDQTVHLDAVETP